MDALRQTLEPLAWDESSSPPEGLAERTLANIAARAPMRPLPTSRRGGVPWRRMVEAAAVVLITATVLGAGISWLGRLRVQYPDGPANPVDVVACKNNLHEVFALLRAYGDAHHGDFPNVAAAVQPSRNAGGLVFSILHDSNLLPGDVKIACPSAAGPSPVLVGLSDVKAMNDAAYQQWAMQQQNGYAYSLGYRQGDHLIGLRWTTANPVR